LLVQIVDGLPERQNYGSFLSSMTSSFQFRERSIENTECCIRGFVPGEIVRGHLFYDPRYGAALAQRNAVHYFIYRDPRDVVLSGAHYVRNANRWHKLHRYFRHTNSIDDAIEMGIRGLQPPVPGVDFPNVAERLKRYVEWIDDDNCMAIKFEDLRSAAQPAIIRQMAEFYAAHCGNTVDIDAIAAAMQAGIAPEKSHTFRSGKKGGWVQAYTAKHRRLFQEIAGDLLVRLGYEQDDSWVDRVEEAIS
jgi:hypothetical protein